jgi:hypothetical protein
MRIEYTEYELKKARHRLVHTLRRLETNLTSVIRVSTGQLTGADTAGVIYANVSTAQVTYGMDKFSTPRGHGFAAERANHLADMLSGKDATIAGDLNELNGPDRIVNGVEIQSKYCNTGSKCIAECFKDGKFRYFSEDGTPMKIEVPLDKYDDAIKAMEHRIKNGQVPGVSDPNEAKNIVRKGHYTYEQAKNIAKFGTVDSLKFDAANGLVIASTAMGISALITFSVVLWRGEDVSVALKSAALSGIRVGGITWITSIMCSQLARTGVEASLRGSTDYIVKLMGPKVSAHFANALRGGKNIYGAAAMNNVSKMLRSNMVTGVVTIAVLSTGEVESIKMV